MLRQGVRALGGEHDAPGTVCFTNGFAGMLADLSRKDILDIQFGTHPDQQGIHTSRIGVSQFCQVADPHQYLSAGMAFTNLAVASDRVNEAEMDRVENRVKQKSPACSGKSFRSPVQGIQIAMCRGDEDRCCSHFFSDPQVVFVQTEHVVGPGPASPDKVVIVKGINADCESFVFQGSDRFFQVRERGIRKTADVDDVRPFRSVMRGSFNDFVDFKLRCVGNLGENPQRVFVQIRFLMRFAEVGRQVLQFLGPAFERDIELGGQLFDVT